jgi:ABC-type polysaccharide/polyol phosphate export permease
LADALARSPGWCLFEGAPLRVCADHQPMTHIINAIRDTQLALPGQGATLPAVLWLTGLAAIFAALAILANRRLKLTT